MPIPVVADRLPWRCHSLFRIQNPEENIKVLLEYKAVYNNDDLTKCEKMQDIIKKEEASKYRLLEEKKNREMQLRRKYELEEQVKRREEDKEREERRNK